MTRLKAYGGNQGEQMRPTKFPLSPYRSPIAVNVSGKREQALRIDDCRSIIANRQLHHDLLLHVSFIQISRNEPDILLQDEKAIVYHASNEVSNLLF